MSQLHWEGCATLLLVLLINDANEMFWHSKDDYWAIIFGMIMIITTFARSMDAGLGPLNQEGLCIPHYMDDWLVRVHQSP